MVTKKEKIFEILRYLVVGVLTTIVSLAIYYGLVYTVINPNNAAQLQIANVISWLGSVIFAYVTNRLFVFKSKNKNKLKEVTSFVGSRLVTLFMDMAIMFIGVSVCKGNDKLIKLLSQVVIIVANYVFSKLFVFNNQEHKEKKNITSFLFWLSLIVIPIIDFLRSSLPTNIYIFFISSLFKGALLLYLLFNLLKTKKNISLLVLIGSFIIVELLFVFTKGFDLRREIILLLHTIYLPISLLYLGHEQNQKINDSFLTKIFFFYLLFFLLPYAFSFFSLTPSLSFYDAKREIIGILILLLPIAYRTLKNHYNIIAKILGFLLLFSSLYLWNSLALYLGLFVTIIFFMWQDRKKFKKEIFTVIPVLLLTIFLSSWSLAESQINLTNFNGRIEDVKQVNMTFQQANIEEQIFGLESITEVHLGKTRIDLVDLFYAFGYLGFSFYLIILGSSLLKLKIKSYYLFSIILALVGSILSGNILINASLAIWILAIGNASFLKPKKRILLVSNMYPSSKNKHYGSFVKNTYQQLISFNYEIDKVTMKKTNNLFRILNYVRLYLRAFYKSIFHSYDYIYVHFISHSGFPVLLGRLTSKNTELICNAHGNDAVSDSEKDQKNIIRSQIVLKYTDTVVVPSTYFKEVMIKDYHIEPSSIKIYPSGGVNFEVFQKLDQQKCRRELNLDEDKYYIGCVTRLEKDKGWDTLVKAINHLKDEPMMKKSKVILIGGGKDQEEFTKLINQDELNEYFIQKEFVFQEDLVKYYNAFDLFIFPTKRKSESLGLVGLEAMACQTFSIICNMYGPREYAFNHKNSLTYVSDEEGLILAEKIKEAWQMPLKNKNKIIKEAIQTAKDYDKDKLKDKLKEIFED